MTRRQLLLASPAAWWKPAAGDRDAVVIPVHQILDARVKWRAEQIQWFQSDLWREAVRDLQRCGVRFEITQGSSDMWRPPDHHPEVNGLKPGVLNFFVTHQIPMHWDRGRGLRGITTRYNGRHLCMIALNHAHAHRAPLIAVNTCLHELLHALLLDIYEGRPGGLVGELRELRIDLLATRLWLFGDGEAIRKSARAYLERLRSDTGNATVHPVKA
jgi:hypothetical protein